MLAELPAVLDFGALFLDQEADDEDATSLAEMLVALDAGMAARDAAMGRHRGPFKASDVAEMVNAETRDANALIVNGFLFPTLPSGSAVTPKGVGKRLKAHVGEPVNYGKQTLTLKAKMDKIANSITFEVAIK
jgi:hypothetical protein